MRPIGPACSRRSTRLEPERLWQVSPTMLSEDSSAADRRSDHILIAQYEKTVGYTILQHLHRRCPSRTLLTNL